MIVPQNKRNALQNTTFEHWAGYSGPRWCVHWCTGCKCYLCWELRVQGKLSITSHLYLYSLLAVFSFISVMSAIKLSRIKYFGTLILIQIVQCPSIHHDMFSVQCTEQIIYMTEAILDLNVNVHPGQDIVETSKEDNVSKEMRLLNCTQNFKSNYPRRIWFHRKKEEW